MLGTRRVRAPGRLAKRLKVAAAYRHSSTLRHLGQCVAHLLEEAVQPTHQRGCGGQIAALAQTLKFGAHVGHFLGAQSVVVGAGLVRGAGAAYGMPWGLELALGLALILEDPTIVERWAQGDLTGAERAKLSSGGRAGLRLPVVQGS